MIEQMSRERAAEGAQVEIEARHGEVVISPLKPKLRSRPGCEQSDRRPGPPDHLHPSHGVGGDPDRRAHEARGFDRAQ
jgi:hypothetical protein